MNNVKKLIIFFIVLVIFGGVIAGKGALNLKKKLDNRYNEVNNYLNKLEVKKWS